MKQTMMDEAAIVQEIEFVDVTIMIPISSASSRRTRDRGKRVLALLRYLNAIIFQKQVEVFGKQVSASEHDLHSVCLSVVTHFN